MLLRIISSALALTCSLAAAPAFAEFESLNSSLILSGGYTKAQNACETPWLAYGINSGGSCYENHTAMRLAYNYHFTPVWGFEASYGDLGNATGNGTSSTYGTPATWSIKVMGWAFAGTATVPIAGGFSLFGKLGTVRAEFNENLETTTGTGVPMHGISFNGVPISRQIKNAVTYGVGVQYELNKTFALRAQYENFGSYDIYSAYGVSSPPRITLSMLSAGIVLKF